jgi:hypothetical protein
MTCVRALSTGCTMTCYGCQARHGGYGRDPSAVGFGASDDHPWVVPTGVHPVPPSSSVDGAVPARQIASAAAESAA